VKFGAFPGLVLPRVPGHEVAGRIDALGAGVDGWRVGERVGVGWHGGHCFRCTPCRKGMFIDCERAKVTGVSHDGGYAEFMVAPIESVARIPDALEASAAGPLLCAGITTYNSMRNSGARAGDTVAVQGIGGLGHLALLLSGKTIAGWPSGTAMDSEETMSFSALTGVRPRIESFPLERAEEAFARVMENRVGFRAVVVP
jgi:D-arabinose 1-dehydrogenase-like Zn-dependent alcohol dehydrogenase